MARSRNIKHKFFLNDDLADLPALCRLLFIGLWCIADREGRLEDKPRRIKTEALPYDDCDIEDLISKLAEANFIKRYTVNEENYIQITTFKKHQNPHKNEIPSVIPAFSIQQKNKTQSEIGIIPDNIVPTPDNIGTNTDSIAPSISALGLIPDSLYPDSLYYSSKESPNTNDASLDEKEKEDIPIELTPLQQMANKLTDLLISKISGNNAAWLLPNQQIHTKWSKTMELMLSKDKRSPEDIERIICWCQADNFWKGNILSCDSLRKHFDRFLVQSKSQGSKQESVKNGPLPKRNNFEQREYDDSFFAKINGLNKKTDSG